MTAQTLAKNFRCAHCQSPMQSVTMFIPQPNGSIEVQTQILEYQEVAKAYSNAAAFASNQSLNNIVNLKDLF